jgi:hypothetical protein
MDQFLEGLINNPLPNDAGADTTADFVVGLVKNGLILVFAVVVLIGVVYAALAGYKYIRSEGDADEVQGAQEAIKSVLIGVGAAFVGVLAIIIINAVFAPGSGADAAIRCAAGDINACSTGVACPAGSKKCTTGKYEGLCIRSGVPCCVDGKSYCDDGSGTYNCYQTNTCQEFNESVVVN